MWPKYIVQDNFISKNHADILSKISWSTPAEGWDIIKSRVSLQGEVTISQNYSKTSANNLPSKNFIEELYYSYQPKMLVMLNNLAPEKYIKLSFSELNIVSTGKNYVYPIHNDLEDKLLSVVIYISPEKNKGTFLYDSKSGSNKREIEWKPRRAFAFSRTDNSWHSYESNGISNRVALVYNLKG